MSVPVTGRVMPAARVSGAAPYVSPPPPYPVDLWLNSNEGPLPPTAARALEHDSAAELIRRYPSVGALEGALAECFAMPQEQVLATAGADDALYRACLAALEPGREMILPTPTFEMLERYAAIAGGTVVEIAWMGGPYPTDAVVAALTACTAVVSVVSPNNPTGAVATADDLRRLSAAAPAALLLVDLAYAEFADEDLTAAALRLPNALVVRTFSKAWGLAGLRVGYAVGPPEVIRWLRTVGNPYAVAGLSAALALDHLRSSASALATYVARVRNERDELTELLRDLGAEPLASQGNFVLARFGDAAAVWKGLAEYAIAVRAFPGHLRLQNHLRITCPGDATAFKRLVTVLRQIAR